jgi:hypothetical protein
VDRYHWESDLGYRVSANPIPGRALVYLPWAPRDPANPRSPGELLEGAATLQGAYQVAEQHWAEQKARAAC